MSQNIYFLEPGVDNLKNNKFPALILRLITFNITVNLRVTRACVENKSLNEYDDTDVLRLAQNVTNIWLQMLA